MASDQPEPALADDQVLVRVEASVVGEPELGHRVECTPGGAAVGTVARAGEAASHLVGKRVLVGPEQGCGECDVCRRGEVPVCPQGVWLGRSADGTLATAVVARARWVCVLERELSGVDGLDGPAAALVAREAAWAYAMFARAGVAPGEPVVILGRGVIARFLVQVAVAKGVRPMLVVAPDDTGLSAWAEAHGGVAVHAPAPSGPAGPDHTPDPQHDAGQLRAALAAAAERGGHGRRPWFVFETSAQPAGQQRAVALVGPGARLVLLSPRAMGRDHTAATLSLDPLLSAGATLVAVPGAHPDLLPEVAALVVRGELDVASAAHVAAIEDILAGEAAGAAPDRSPRALVATLGVV